MSVPPRSRRNGWLVAAMFLAVIGVGAFVGTRAGDLAHRAPRGSGKRIAVLGPLSLGANPSDHATEAIAQDALVRELSSLPGLTVIPPLEVRSKRLQMEAGGVASPSDSDSAQVLDAEVLITVRPAAGGAQALIGETVIADIDGPTAQLPAALAAARKAVGDAGAAREPVTGSAAAYAHFLQGEHLAQAEGLFREAIIPLEQAVALDAQFAEAWTAIAWCLFFADDRTPQETARMKEAVAAGRVNAQRSSAAGSLVLDALGAWLAHDDAAPELRIALREPAIAGARALTVKLPEERNGHLLLGRAYRELFDGASEGLRHLEAGRRLTPDYFPITQQIVIAWLDIGDRKHAEQALRGFLATSPGHREATRLFEGLTHGVASRTKPPQ